MNYKEMLYTDLMNKEVTKKDYNLISSILNKNEIREELFKIFHRIGFDKIKINVKQNIFNFILLYDGLDYKAKIDLLKYLQNNSLIDFSKMDNKLEILDFEDIFEWNVVFLKYQDFIKSLGEYIFSITSFRYGQGSTTQGRGELFLAFFGNGKLADKGDIILNNTFYEVKSNSGVIYSLLNINSFRVPVKTDLPFNNGILSYEDLYEYLKINAVPFPTTLNKNNLFKFIDKLLDVYEENPTKELELFIRQFYHFVITYRVSDNVIREKIYNYIEKLNNYVVKRRINLQLALDLINRKLGILSFYKYKEELGFDKVLFFYKKDRYIAVKEIEDPRDIKGLKYENMGFITNGGRPYQVVLKLKKD